MDGGLSWYSAGGRQGGIIFGYTLTQILGDGLKRFGLRVVRSDSRPGDSRATEQPFPAIRAAGGFSRGENHGSLAQDGWCFGWWAGGG